MSTINRMKKLNVFSKVITSVGPKSAGKTVSAMDQLFQHCEEYDIPHDQRMVVNIAESAGDTLPEGLQELQKLHSGIKMTNVRTLADVFSLVKSSKPNAVLINNLQFFCSNHGRGKDDPDVLVNNMEGIFAEMAEAESQPIVIATAKIDDDNGVCNNRLKELLAVFANREQLGEYQGPTFLK